VCPFDNTGSDADSGTVIGAGVLIVFVGFCALVAVLGNGTRPSILRVAAITLTVAVIAGGFYLVFRNHGSTGAGVKSHTSLVTHQ
jgi:hypothetical protein